MRRIPFVLTVVGVMAGALIAAPVSAQRYRASCAACQPIVDQLEELEQQWAEAQRNYYKELGASMDLLRQNVNDRTLIGVAQRENSPEVAAKTVNEIEARIAAREPAIKEHQDRTVHYGRLSNSLRLEMTRLSVDLEACNRRCNTPGAAQDPPRGGGSTPPITAQPADAPEVAPDCPACRDLADRLNDLLQQRATARQVLDGIAASRKAVLADQAERQAELERLQKRPANERSYDLEAGVEDRLEFSREQLRQLDEYQKFWEGEIRRLDAAIAPLQEEFDRCDKACRPPTQTGSLFPPKTWFVAGGAVLGGLVIARRGDPPTTPQASPTPAPTATPQAPATPTVTTPAPTQPTPPARQPIDGNYACTSCTVAGDNGGHNPFIRLCEALVAVFGVREGSITIAHPAPFVAITGDFNTTSGAFTATGRGTVAGLANVGVRGEGTAVSTSGEIRFMYTMGTGGELPGGQSITYSISLVKR